MEQDLTIHQIVRKMEEDYTTGKTTISKYVEFSLFETIEKIEAYLNSTHVNGRKDSMDRIKPFFNIVTSAVNIWYRATDLDRKNIRLKAVKNNQQPLVFCATALLNDFMRRTSFGAFLNDWGRTLARYGSAVVKFIEKEDGLRCEITPWNRLIVDSVDFDNNIKIEKLYFTPAQLRKNKKYNQDFVKELIDSLGPRQTTEGISKDNKNDYISVYEVHGELPLSLLKKAQGKNPTKADEEIYINQMHVVSFVAKKNPDGEEYFDDCTLYAGREAESPYFITHLIKEDGRTLGIGAVEHLFEAQWMVNHTAKAIKDQLDLSSKLIFQTADGNFVGQNVLKNIQSGDIMKHALNMPVTKINNDTSGDVTSLRAYMTQWQLLSKDITSTPEAMRGDTMPSGTAYRQVALLQEQAGSLFEIMTENKGLALEEILRRFIIPYLKKKMDTSDEISAILEDNQITQIDAIYLPNQSVKRANRKIINKILAGDYEPGMSQEIMAGEEQNLKQQLGVMGNQRFFKPSEISAKTWKEVLKDFEWEVEVEITNETIDKQAVFETLTSVMQTIAANPMVLQDPNMKLLFNKIINETGRVSPIELTIPARPVGQVMPVWSAAGTKQEAITP